jgi:hypothetical protein
MGDEDGGDEDGFRARVAASREHGVWQVEQESITRRHVFWLVVA